MLKRRIVLLSALCLWATSAQAWFFIFPLPNLAKPRELQAIIDALEKSEQTRSVAYASEDKSFGQKMWVWGKYSGEVSQTEADQWALDQCRRSLVNAKTKSEGGQRIYDFGAKDCELHPFTPNDGPKRAEIKRKAAEDERQRVAAIEEAKRVAAEEERKRIAAEEESKKVSAKEDQQHLAAEQMQPITPEKSRIDFTIEATKAARILGCQPTGTKVTGIEKGNILYDVQCSNKSVLELACDQSGLCLKK